MAEMAEADRLAERRLGILAETAAEPGGAFTINQWAADLRAALAAYDALVKP